MLLLNRGLRILKSKQYYGHNPNPWNSRICLILLPAPWMTLMCYNIPVGQNRTYPLPPSQTPDSQTFPCRYSSQCLVHTSSGIPGRLVNRKEWWGNSYCYKHGRCRETFFWCWNYDSRKAGVLWGKKMSTHPHAGEACCEHTRWH